MTAPETIQRKILAKHLRTNWTTSPLAIPGVSFDPTVAADVTPFTTAQVRDSVGYVELSLREVDTFFNAGTSGLAEISPGVWEHVTTLYTLTRARVTIRLPGKRNNLEQTLETYSDTLVNLLIGLRVVHEGPPKVILRQLPTDTPRLWEDRDEGDWRRRDVDVLIRRWERKQHQGVLEVAI